MLSYLHWVKKKELQILKARFGNDNFLSDMQLCSPMLKESAG